MASTRQARAVVSAGDSWSPTTDGPSTVFASWSGGAYGSAWAVAAYSGHTWEQSMAEPGARTLESILRMYFRAKDENRPHLMAQVFSEAARLETIVKTGGIAFPPVATGLAAITESLVRTFGRTYENVYSFYLARPKPGAHPDTFACDWLVGMSAKQDGSIRVGCGRYDWHFQSDAHRLADRLVITIEAMPVLAPDYLSRVLGWVTALPHPWCSAERILQTAPAIESLAPILAYVGRNGKSPRPRARP